MDTQVMVVTIDGWLKSGEFWILGNWIAHPSYSDGEDLYAISGAGRTKVPDRLAAHLKTLPNYSHGLRREIIQVPGRWAVRQRCEEIIKTYRGPDLPYD